MRPHSFQQLPIGMWKYVTPELGQFTNYREFPTFVNARAFPVPEFHQTAEAYDALSSPMHARQVMSYYFDQVFAFNGFQFKFAYNHGKTLVHKTGFSNHQPVQFRKIYQKNWDVVESGPAGDIYIYGQPGEKMTIVCAEDNYDKEVSIPKTGLFSYLVDNILFSYPTLNWSAAVQTQLPDFGCRIK